MLLTREEMTFDFGGAMLDPVRDRALLGWVMNQFLYGEVTGIQVGHWLFGAPDLEAARFLARQAVEELQHVDNFLRILALLGEKPARPHPAVRFLSTGMMGASWAEHVALEMAAGEGFVLMAFYAIIDTLDHAAIVEILRRAVKQEERHVEFGERQTMKAIEGRPGLKRRLLGLQLVSRAGVRWLARFMGRRLPKEHPVLSQLPRFLQKTLDAGELRLQRMGLLSGRVEDLSLLRKLALVGEAYGAKVLSAMVRLLSAPLRVVLGGPRRLTDTYLNDPAVRAPRVSDVPSEESAA